MVDGIDTRTQPELRDSTGKVRGAPTQGTKCCWLPVKVRARLIPAQRLSDHDKLEPARSMAQQ